MRNKIIIYIGLLVGILLLGGVLAYPILDSGIKKALNEDQSPVYSYNFTQNVTGYSVTDIFSIYSINSSQHSGFTSPNNFTWITINSTTGVMTINSTLNNETGNFTISIQVIDTNEEGTTVASEFIINATNDAPNFTTINNAYNLTQDQLFFEYINASDEEEHYPLYFNIHFFNNCTHASWSGRSPGENCSIFNLTNIANISALMNLTPTRNDVGTYWANITVMDFGENYSCPHAYCENTTYEQNKTTYSEIIKFDVFSILEINVSDCQNKIFQENQSGTCQINITTKGEIDSLNISSIASLRNYDAGVSNTSWFYANDSANAANFTSTININVTPQKTEIGNWTINLTVYDITSGENSVAQIYVYVNRTSNDIPDLVNIENTNTSTDLLKRINLTVYDDDLLIPDKNASSGGYNETITFNVIILNQSNLSQELSISGFDVEILYMPVSGTNRTEAKIEFTPNSSEAGDYTINITVNDSENSLDSDVFNLSIISNEFPSWNQTSYSFALIVNSTFATTAAFGQINLTGDGYVTDTGDTLTFTNDSSAMPRFNLTSDGLISFTPYKEDVGNWSFNVTATDSFGLQNTTIFTFNITNINSVPVIQTPLSVTNASVTANSNITAQEDNYTTITLWVQDDDFKISSAQKSYYNESSNINLTIEGPNPNLFNFTKTSDFPTDNFPNRTEYDAIFTPNKIDVGTYNITINITDASNSSDILKFNLTVNEVNDAPILTEITNQTSAVNRILYYDVNASDEEDGNDTQGNLTFNLTFLQGTDFINGNETIFNTTSGILNITFNSSHAGTYRINVVVNDSGNLEDSDDFWVYVYDAPNVTYPVSGENFTLQENVTSNLTFQVNHTIGDNLTYEFYIDNVLRNTTIYYGNGTNLTWQFTPNFTDETYGQFENLTLIVYPTTSELENKTELNTTINYNINISHTNFPVSFSGYIGDEQKNYDQEITINLASYFSDIDYNDVHYNQTVNFSIVSNSTPSYISSSVSNWGLTLSSSIAVTELLNITGNDSSTTATSNSFEVEFTTPTTVTVPTPSGGGGSSTIPVSLKIIVPDPVSAYQGDRIVLPITLYNNGKKTLFDINLTSIIVKNNLVGEDITFSLDKYYFSSLAVEKKENVTLTVNVNTNKTGTFEITINAKVKNPEYNDWGKVYFTIKESEGTLDKLLFLEEFLRDNPECIELQEIADEAREYFKKGDFINTVLKINQAIGGCKEAISQQSRAKRREVVEDSLYKYLLIATLIAFFIGIVYYSYKRIKLKRSYMGHEFKTPENKLIFNNKTSLVFMLIGLIGILVTTNTNITGFVIKNSTNQNGFNLNFIFIIGILGFLIFLSREKIRKFIEISINKIRGKYSINKIKDLKKKQTQDFHTSLTSLRKKKVYTGSGDYLGKVEEVILERNKINSLKITLDKKIKRKNKIKIKGIIVKYKHVKSVGHIVIIRGKIWEKIL